MAGVISDDQYDCFKRDIYNYLAVYLAFFGKYPKISQPFMEALILGRLTFSDQQSKSAEQLFLQMKSSKFIKLKSVVKAEPEPMRAEHGHDGAQELDAKDEDEPMILPLIEDETHLAQLVNFTCELYKSIQKNCLHYLLDTFVDFSNVTFRDGIVQHIVRGKMEDNPMDAYRLLTTLKFSSEHGQLVQCFAALTKLKFDGYRQVFNDFAGPAERLIEIDRNMNSASP